MQTGLMGAGEADPEVLAPADPEAWAGSGQVADDVRAVRLGFLTSVYTKQSHTFMRQEVARLRDLGWDVQTFSIRRAPESEMVDEEVRREHERTEYVLDAGAFRMVVAAIREVFRSPLQFFATVGVMWRVRTPGLKGHVWPLLYLVEACYLARLLRARGVEHLHNHLGRNSAVVAMLASSLTNIPYSLTIHGPTEFDEPGTLALGLKIHRSAFTVAISDYGRSQLCRWTSLADWPKIHVVHCGVSRAFRDAVPPPLPDAPRLVSVGRLAEQKGQLVLVEAVALLRDRGVDFQLEIVGDGPMRGEIERRISALGLANHVHLAGWRDSAGVRQAMVDSRLFVLPSFAEGLPVVLMESLALGRPVVSTYVAGIPELVRPGREGWLVPPGSAVALAEALTEALATDTTKLAAMGRSGADRVAIRHDAVVEARKLARLITRSEAGSSTSSGHNSLKQMMIHGAAWTMIERFASQVVRLAGNIILSRLLFPDDFGTAAAFAVFQQSILVFSELGIEQSLIQNKNGDQPRFLNTGWTLQLVRGITLSVIAASLAWPVANWWFKKPELTPMLLIASLVILITHMTSTKAILAARNMQQGLLSKRSLISQVAGLVSMIILSFWFRSAWGLVIGGLIGEIVRTVLSYVSFPGPKSRLCWDRGVVAEILGFGRWIFVTTILNFLGTQGDRILMGRYLSVTVFGLYNIGFVLSSIPALTVQMLGPRVVFPSLSRIVQSEPARVAPVFDRLSRLLYLGLMPGIGLLLGGAPLVIDILYDARYAGAGWMASLLAFRAVTECMAGPGQAALMALGQPQYSAVMQGVRAATIMIGMPLTLRWFGLPSAIALAGLSGLGGVVVVQWGLWRHGLASFRREAFGLALLAIGTVLGFGLDRVLGPYLR